VGTETYVSNVCKELKESVCMIFFSLIISFIVFVLNMNLLETI